jgi:hypothetical protein
MPVLLLPRGLAAVPGPATFPAVKIEVNFSVLTGWTDITPYADFSGGNQATITRGSNRVESPVIRYDAGTATIPLDNTDRRFDPTNLAGPYVGGIIVASFVKPCANVRVSATYSSITYRLINGTADSWTLSYSAPSDAQAAVSCTDGFRVLAVQARTARTVFQGGGEDAGARVTRILNDCGWPSAKRSIVPGNSTLQPTLLGGTPVGVVPLAVAAAGGTQTTSAVTAVSTLAPLDELQLTAETEMGELYVNGNGFLVFRNRQALLRDTRSNTSQATFGDDPAVPTTELPYASVTPAYDDSTLWNGAAIANQGGTLQQAADATSQQLPPDGFGPHVYDSENLIADSDWQALGYAQFIVASSKNPELRYSAITIDPIALPATLFPQVLGREIGDRITITRRPPGGGSPNTRDVFIRGISHQFTDSTWLTTWVLEDATSLPPLLFLDGSMLLDGTHPYGF